MREFKDFTCPSCSADLKVAGLLGEHPSVYIAEALAQIQNAEEAAIRELRPIEHGTIRSYVYHDGQEKLLAAYKLLQDAHRCFSPDLLNVKTEKEPSRKP